VVSKKFKSIFEGLDIAYGQHQPGGSRADGKQQGKSYMVTKEVTDELWEKHLKGENPSLGIIPIRADNTTKWGCIDIDTYPLDHRALINKIRKLDLPLVYCKSKSGGAHLFLFMQQPIASKLVRSKLTDMAATIGHSNSEVFPKQSGIQIEKGDLGSFLNLPYFNSDKSVRYAIKDDSTAATIEEFFDMYDKYAVKDIEKTGTEVTKEVIKDGPPCLQALCSQGFAAGTRNNGLFNIGVYLKKFDPDNWEKLLEDHNQKFMKPPLDHREVGAVVKALDKKGYMYKCKDQPIVSYCNVNLCKTRKHGVGSDNSYVQIISLTVLNTEPPYFIAEIMSDDPKSDHKIQLATEELQIQTKFQKRAMEVLKMMPPLMKNIDWQKYINGLLEKATNIYFANDGTVSGQFFSHLQEFCTDRAQAQKKEEITLRKPWTEWVKEIDENKKEVKLQRTYFRLQDLHAYLIRNKFTHYTNTGQIIAELRKFKGVARFWKLEGKGVNTWGVPAFPKPNVEHEIQEQNVVPY
jgi:hypothetical protein